MTTTSEPKLIVAVDFGTTFSGVAFVSISATYSADYC